ncbi:DUF1501 domain-containing protein [Aporhodopirellula aestuarii]|uniref:DUF1501 domain-containing protein n=1 Tax=Aporhodopirellula aestuarii TaxID=2950107 RepID=A0ABT0TWV4_9BACT|nr:DUF1501 domain-containing protein [Aporhodopirellula aestuarii]MCM2369097.1 DUF1501 domain-containing protein [Aporhodopirellula aestuarii]
MYGHSDEFAFHVAKNLLHIRDLQATLLHLCGDHERFTHRHQGLDFKRTDVELASVVNSILA